ncbi:hypothetical protein D9611_006713 [Ephemerocybe angulata]|uniref:DUF6533 domain-containing protein n=1 Tax=Ephemerocybe angulata TaxID=980116 RepID=A0A8H5FH95_9AGAR|nr:hypothetical protein D9611_006713 [Tulosesus angulatus]
MDIHATLLKILEGYRHVELTRYTQLAATSIIIFDHLLTFDGEVEHIWNASWSAGKVVYLINRYYTLASVVMNTYGFYRVHLTNEFCLHFLRWQGWTGLVSCLISEVILQMRIYAMYSLDRKVLAFMTISFAASIAISGWIMGTTLIKMTPLAVHVPGGMFCMPVGISSHFYTLWIPMLLFELLLCTLALARGFSTFVSNGSLIRTGQRLVVVLFRDSVIYFVVICATYMTCLLLWLLAPVTLLEVPITFTVAVSCVLGNRIILNVRELRADRVSLPAGAISQQSVKWDTEQPPVGSKYVRSNVSFADEGGLNPIEMGKLRRLRSAPSLSKKAGISRR